MKLKYWTKAIIFILIACVFFLCLNYFFIPVRYNYNNYDSMRGFYNEPENTIETLFLGSSHTVIGFIPIELYEDYGICAYNLGTEQQPMLASYYWLEEAYRLHPETLKTVILDCSMTRRRGEMIWHQVALDRMQFSPIKYQAVKDYSEIFDVDTLSYMIPFFEYHNRWSSLSQIDFEEAEYKVNDCVRGYNFTTDRFYNAAAEKNALILEYLSEQSVQKQTLNSDAIKYLKKVIEFCQEKNIRLILAKVPVYGWTSSAHNAIAEIAEEYGVEFLDFNFTPLLDEIGGYKILLDNSDGDHMNYYSATRLTAWFGEYLSKYCNATDVRSDPRYAYMEYQLTEYHTKYTIPLKLQNETDPYSYIAAAMKQKEYSILIAIRDEGTDALTPAQKECFSSIGLEHLASLGSRDSYLAVIEGGVVTYEMTQHMEPDFAETPEPLTWQGTLCDGKAYTLASGGAQLGNIASCLIDDSEYAKNQRGINIVVYDTKHHTVADSAVFDTYVSSVRTAPDIVSQLTVAEAEGVPYNELPADLQQLYLYSYQCDVSYKTKLVNHSIGVDGLWDFLSAYWDDENIAIFLSAMDDAAGALDQTARDAFAQWGLWEMSALGYRDSYLAVINGGNVLYEQRDHGEYPIETEGVGYHLTSGGFESGNTSSILINNVEYSYGTRGINVVIYDTLLKETINQASFDTCITPVHISEQQ